MHRSVSFNGVNEVGIHSSTNHPALPIKSAPLTKQASKREAGNVARSKSKPTTTKDKSRSKQRSSSLPLVSLNEAFNKGECVSGNVENPNYDDDNFSFVQTAPLQVHDSVKKKQREYTKLDLPIIELKNGTLTSKASTFAHLKSQSSAANSSRENNHKVTKGQSSKKVVDDTHGQTPKPFGESEASKTENDVMLTSSAMTKCSFKMIRSNGGFRPVLKDTPTYFPYDELYGNSKNNTDSHRANSDTDSSFFDIETPSDDGDIIRESPIPVDQDFYITSPHNPPFDPHTPNSMKDSTLRQDIIRSQSSRFLPMADYLQEYMEDRLISWRPGDSQFNNDAMMNGNHPYQQYQENIKSGMNRNLFSSFRKWFGNEKLEEETNAEQQNNTVVCRQENAADESSEPSVGARQVGCSNTPEIVRMMSRSEFKSNSSNSFLPHICSTSKSNFSPSTNAAMVINNEPCPAPETEYTPKALPFYAFELNYEKKPNGVTGLEPNAEIIDAIDEDVRNLIEGSENFLSDCFSGFLSLFCP